MRLVEHRKWTIALSAALAMAAANGLWALFLQRNGNDMRAALAAAHGEIQQLNTQVGQLQQAAQEQAVQLELARRPDLPVTVRFRRTSAAAFSAAFVSAAPSQLEILVAITDPVHHLERRFDLTLLPQQLRDSPRGWEFRPGEEVDLTSDGFQPLQLTVPGQPQSLDSPSSPP